MIVARRSRYAEYYSAAPYLNRNYSGKGKLKWRGDAGFAGVPLQGLRIGTFTYTVAPEKL